ncbi:MAG: hypothetical protein MI746_17990 [Pseudomonadales bacterium]|nr:hypothetical protein [Pseudomonadales bacterium]
MKLRFQKARFASLLFALGVGINNQTTAQELTAAEEALTKAQAQRHVERYYNYYYERNPEALSTEIFTLPWYVIGANGITARATEAENMEYFSSAIDGLLERGWNRSIFTTKNVCVFGAGSAIVSGTNTRTRTDGSIMSVGGVSYTLGTTNDGWRILSFSSHAPNKVVRCDTE